MTHTSAQEYLSTRGASSRVGGDLSKVNAVANTITFQCSYRLRMLF